MKPFSNTVAVEDWAFCDADVVGVFCCYIGNAKSKDQMIAWKVKDEYLSIEYCQ